MQELSTVLAGVGAAFQQTDDTLAGLPPPTFEGGDRVAEEIQTNLQDGGAVFMEYGARALEIDPTDAAAGEQFLADFRDATGDITITSFEPTPELQQAVRAIPACDKVFGSGG